MDVGIFLRGRSSTAIRAITTQGKAARQPFQFMIVRNPTVAVPLEATDFTQQRLVKAIP